MAVGDAVSLEPRANGDAVVGFTGPGSAVNAIRVTAPAEISATGIEEGRLAGVDIRGSEVLYQIVGAQTHHDQIGGQAHERFRIDAQKLGKWNEGNHSFELVPWLPDPGTPVALKMPQNREFDAEAIGYVPGTRYSIRYKAAPAITHNTALIGVLGSGKTTLARELVCRNVTAGAKVVVLDITGQYAPLFDDLVPAGEANERVQGFNEHLADWHERTVPDESHLFGSVGEYRRHLRVDLEAFLQGNEHLRIYNPLALTATTMEGFARNGRAELLRELTVVEKTSVFAQVLLEITAAMGETTDPRVCLVLEEAHSLTPEPSEGLTSEDRRAVATSARAILQGRKYGYGSLLIAQRTANVTKTILNQCQTVFAFRSYDATGIAFLSNYLGEEYSRVLTSMPKFHAVCFGEGISCDAPILLELNDPTEFVDTYWTPHVADLREAGQQAQGDEAAMPEPLQADDDIPF